MLNTEYWSKLKVGIDVDWVKTLPGRTATMKSRQNGVNVPKLFKERGFDHVRLRITEDVRTSMTLIEEIKAIVHECLAADLIPVISYQAEGFKDNPCSDDALRDVVAWWTQVNSAFDPSLEIGLNLIIETTGSLLRTNNARLNLCYLRCAEAIQVYSQNRILICGTNDISNPYELPNLSLPAPTNQSIAEWHMYAAGPSRITKNKLWTTGTDAEKKLITDRIDFARNWSVRTGIPTWVGAWMAADFNQDDDPKAYSTHVDGAPASANYTIEEQTSFAAFMVGTLRAAGIPFAVNSDTKFFDREANVFYESVKPVLDAILG
jgi:Cellulase (glycosyl hydrolase family 5)